MIQPVQLVYPWQLLSSEHLPRIIKGKTRHQNLIALRQRHHSRAGVHLNAIKMFGTVRLFFFANEDFSDVNANTIADQNRALFVQRSHIGLEQQ